MLFTWLNSSFRRSDFVKQMENISLKLIILSQLDEKMLEWPLASSCNLELTQISTSSS